MRIMFKWCMWKTHDLVLIKNPLNIKNPKFQNVWKPLRKCMKSCNLMKKKGQKGLKYYLKFLKKTFKSWTKKTKKKKEKKNCEKGSKEESERKTKNSLKKKKTDLIPICFKNLKSDRSRRIGKELKCTWK